MFFHTLKHLTSHLNHLLALIATLHHRHCFSVSPLYFTETYPPLLVMHPCLSALFPFGNKKRSWWIFITKLAQTMRGVDSIDQDYAFHPYSGEHLCREVSGCLYPGGCSTEWGSGLGGFRSGCLIHLQVLECSMRGWVFVFTSSQLFIRRPMVRENRPLRP